MKEMLSLSTERFISVWQFANQHGVKLWECCIKSFVLKQDNLFQIYAKRWNDLSILLKSIDQFRYTKTIHLGTRLRAITTELMWFIPMSLACINLGRILIYRNRSIHTKKKNRGPAWIWSLAEFCLTEILKYEDLIACSTQQQLILSN